MTFIMDKAFSPASERNGPPILAVLKDAFADCRRVLEIGSGTGQHAVYFGARLPPLALDVRQPWMQWPQAPFDAVFSANTLHIMPWPAVESMFAGIGHMLQDGGMLCIYGPFNVGGAYTSDSNARFDTTKHTQTAQKGNRDIEQ